MVYHNDFSIRQHTPKKNAAIGDSDNCNNKEGEYMLAFICVLDCESFHLE